MGLTFPNAARSFDDAKRRIRFVGHDGMFEVKCFVDADVVMEGMSQRTATESDYLAAFDRMLGKIQEVAMRAYKAQSRPSIMLSRQDFR